MSTGRLHIGTLRPSRHRALLALSGACATLVVTGCGSEPTSGTAAPGTVAPTTTAVVSTTAAPTTITPTTVAATTTTTTTTTVAATTTTVTATAPANAIWPASEVVFTTPEAAATDFVEQVLGVPAVLGPFVAGDPDSGEIAVMSPGESSTPIERSTLLLRRAAGGAGWFVIAAAHDTTTVTSPAEGATVPAGPLEVTGVGHGFEASMTVSAVVPGDPVPVASEHTMAGTMETPGDYRVTLDLTGLEPGTTVMLLIRGGTGLETDPGEFGAIGVVVG